MVCGLTGTSFGLTAVISASKYLAWLTVLLHDVQILFNRSTSALPCRQNGIP